MIRQFLIVYKVVILQQGSYFPSSIFPFDMKFITPLTIALLVAAPAIVLAADPPRNQQLQQNPRAHSQQQASLPEVEVYQNKETLPGFETAYENLKAGGSYEIMQVKHVMDLLKNPEDKIDFLEKLKELAVKADLRLVCILFSALKKQPQPVNAFCSSIRSYFGSDYFSKNPQYLNLIEELIGKMIDSLNSNTSDNVDRQKELDIALLNYYQLFISLLQKKELSDYLVQSFNRRCSPHYIETLLKYLFDSLSFNVGADGIPLVKQCARYIEARYKNEPNNEQYKADHDFAQGYLDMFMEAKSPTMFQYDFYEQTYALKEMTAIASKWLPLKEPPQCTNEGQSKRLKYFSIEDSDANNAAGPFLKSSIAKMFLSWKCCDKPYGAIVACEDYLKVARLSGHLREDENFKAEDFFFWRAVATSFDWEKAMDLLRRSYFLPSFVREYMEKNRGTFEEKLDGEQQEALWDYCQLNFDRLRCLQKYSHAVDEGELADIKAEYNVILKKMYLLEEGIKSEDFKFTIPALPEKQ